MSGSVEIPDAAVAAAERAYVAHWKQRHAGGDDIGIRAALVAARPYLMPTREQIVTVIGDALWFEEHPGRTGAEINNVAAVAVVALLNGAES